MLRRRRGFTIIELLVVISIIALLISILLPSLAGARDRARFIKWAGYSHSLRTDVDVSAYYNFEQQGEGNDELWNRASGDPFEMAKLAIEPEDMHGELGRLASSQNFDDTGVKPTWTISDARWKGKGALNYTNSNDEVVHVKSNEILEELSEELSLAMWFSPSTSNMTNRRLLEKGNSWFFLNGAGGSGPINFLAKSQQSGGNHVVSMTDPSTLEAGEWYFLTGQWDGRYPINNTPAMRYWVNGERNGTWANITGNEMMKTKEPLWIGSDDNGAGFDGLIDELCLFNKGMIEFDGSTVIDAKITEMFRVGKPRNKR